MKFTLELESFAKGTWLDGPAYSCTFFSRIAAANVIKKDKNSTTIPVRDLLIIKTEFRILEIH